MSNTSPNRRAVSSLEQHAQSRDSDNFGKFIWNFNLRNAHSFSLWIGFIYIENKTTPPGTPPPPNKIKQSKSTPQHMSDSKHIRLHPSINERTNPGSHVLGEHDEFMPNDSRLDHLLA